MGGVRGGEALSKEKKETLPNKRDKKNDHLMAKNKVGFSYLLQSKLKVE